MAPCCDKEIIKAFQFNCKDEGLVNALARRRIQSFTELPDMVRKYCAMENTWRVQQMNMGPPPAAQQGKSRIERAYTHRSPESEPDEKKTKPRSELDELLDKPCPIHSVLLDANPTHRLRACWVIRQVAKYGEPILGLTPPDKHLQLCRKTTMSSRYTRHLPQTIKGKKLFESSTKYIK